MAEILAGISATQTTSNSSGLMPVLPLCGASSSVTQIIFTGTIIAVSGLNYRLQKNTGVTDCGFSACPSGVFFCRLFPHIPPCRFQPNREPKPKKEKEKKKREFSPAFFLLLAATAALFLVHTFRRDVNITAFPVHFPVFMIQLPKLLRW